jgi:hypothetical protein
MTRAGRSASGSQESGAGGPQARFRMAMHAVIDAFGLLLRIQNTSRLIASPE